MVARAACRLKCAIVNHPIFAHFRLYRNHEPFDSSECSYLETEHHRVASAAYSRQTNGYVLRNLPKRCVVPDSEMCIMLILDTLAAALGSRPCRQERAHCGDHADTRGTPYGRLCEPYGTETTGFPKFHRSGGVRRACPDSRCLPSPIRTAGFTAGDLCPAFAATASATLTRSLLSVLALGTLLAGGLCHIQPWAARFCPAGP